MLELVSMWKNPKMIAFTALTAGLYAALIFPFQQFTFFEGNADFLRVGMGIPVSFSMFFGPAAAWGTAIGNLIYDASTASLSTASIFGFVGNFMVGLIPYKLWGILTTEKPDLKTAKKLALFVGLSFLACVVCGIVVASGLYWLGIAPFMPTVAVIALTDACGQ